jgi:hypothetical protein
VLKTSALRLIWVAQRFTAAMTGFFLVPALAAEVKAQIAKGFSAIW